MKVFEAINATIADLRMWRVLAGVIMPDHTRWIVSPAEERGLSVGDFATGFKRSLRKTRDSQSWKWQRGCFDRLLRFDENLQDNPVRQGLVQKREDWPYYVDFINCEGSSQLPLQTDPGKK